MSKFNYEKNAKIFFLMLILFVFNTDARAEDAKKVILQGDLGIAAINEPKLDSAAFSLHYFNCLRPDNSLMLDFGMIVGSAKVNYFAVIFGIKHRSRSDKKISPFIYAAGGLIVEKSHHTFVLIGAAGIDINIKQNLIIPITFQFGMHGLQQGPHLISVGLAHRF